MYKPLTVKDKKITDTASLYSPGKEVIGVTAEVLSDYLAGQEIQTRTREEFNGRSLLEEINANQKAFNSYVPPRSSDPEDSWRAQTVRPVTRNKLISIAAHVTAAILYPNVFAQNSEDDEDKDASIVMRDLIEWTIDNSNYEKSFIQAVISALVDPAIILEAQFLEVMRTVKIKSGEKNEDGSYKYTKKQILDEVLSGFKAFVLPCQHLLIANIYEPDIQRQRFLIKDRYIDYKEAKLIHGEHASFIYVKPGVVTVFDDVSRTFYDVVDEEAKSRLVKETTYYCRADDLELVFVNGILMCAPDAPLKRNDKLYPFAKSGYEPLNNGQFFYLKSAANKLGSDQELVDTLYNLILDGTFLQLMPPMALYGSEDINSSVTIPGMVTSFRDPNTKLENIGPRSDIRAGLETIGMVERSIAQSSQDDIRSGNAQSGDRTAREIVLLEKNAQIQLGLFGKMIGFLVKDFGYLMIGDILQHMTVAQLDEITGETRYKSFLLHDKMEDGQKITKKIKLAPELVGKADIGAEEMRQMQYELLAQEGGIDGKKRIYLVNPEMLPKLKYKVSVNVDEMNPKSKALERALGLEAYDRLIQNPLIDQEAVTRDFLIDSLRPGESDKYIKKEAPMAPPTEGPMGIPTGQKGINGNLAGQITGSNSLGVALSSNE